MTKTTLNSSMRLWISYTNIPDLFPKSSSVQNFKSKYFCCSLAQNPVSRCPPFPETRNCCCNGLGKWILFFRTDVWSKCRLVPHPSRLMMEELPPSSPSYLLLDLAAFQLLWTPQIAVMASVLENALLVAACLIEIFSRSVTIFIYDH